MHDIRIEKDLQHTATNCYRELKQITGQKTLLTGCGGFLGFFMSNLFAYWNNNHNEKIICTLQDNFLRGTPKWIDGFHSDHIKFELHDVLSNYDRFDFHNIIHAASVASPTFYRKFPIETMDANVIGLRNLLENQLLFQNKKNLDTRFLFFSSSEIYGDPLPEFIPTKETYWGNVSCTGPRACYDESKRYGETLCYNFANVKNMHIVIARPFNNYGPGLKLDDGRVISDFANSIKRNRTIQIFSDGGPTRTFCYISDAIAGYIKILVNGKAGESNNIGTDKPEISMLELANMMKNLVEDMTTVKVSIKKEISKDKEYLTHNPNRRCPDITKAKLNLNYSPSVSLEEGLKKTLKWYGVV